jgi:hypothetical protein
VLLEPTIETLHSRSRGGFGSFFVSDILKTSAMRDGTIINISKQSLDVENLNGRESRWHALSFIK